MNRLTTAVFVTALLVGFHTVYGVDFFVAPGGNDTHPGTEAEPFATLERARDAVRKLKQAEPLAEPATIFVESGDYHLTKSLALDGRDSGTPTAPVTWQAAGNDEVRLSGGPKLSPDAFEPVADEVVLQRLDVSARDKVLQIDLRAVGIQNQGSYPEAFRGAPGRVLLEQPARDGDATVLLLGFDGG